MRVRVVVLAVVVGVLLVGCGEPEPEPEPSPTKPPVAEVVPEPPVSPSPTELTPEQQAERLKKQNIKDATAMLTEYYSKYNEVMLTGWKDYSLLFTYVQSQEMVDKFEQWRQNTEEDRRTIVGEQVILGMDILDYQLDSTGAGHETMVIQACIDRSTAQSIESDGSPAERMPDYQPVLFHSYVVQHQGVGQPWMITTDLGFGAPCGSV